MRNGLKRTIRINCAIKPILLFFYLHPYYKSILGVLLRTSFLNIIPMTKTTTLSLVLLTALLLGCTKKEISQDKFHYRAINGKDTALLSITVYEDRFYGEYEMIYGKRGKDSGAVRGQLYGDTLMGEYRYLSYGGSKSIAPFALLNREGKLRLGRGVKATYMGIPFYVKELPIDYELGFVFEPIGKPRK